MIVLIIEIVLTAKAWRKGWGVRALLPGVIGFAIAFLLGMALADSDVPFVGRVILGVIVDVCIVASLIAMVRNAPSATPQVEQPAPISTDLSSPASEVPAP